MDDTIQYWFTTKDVLEALKARNLPSTWAQIKLYRDVKLIPPIRNMVKFHRKDSPIKYSRVTTDEGTQVVTSKRAGTIVSREGHPIFNQQDINEIVEAVARIKADEEASQQANQESV